LLFAARMVGGNEPRAARRRVRKAGRKARDGDAYLNRRLKARDRDDGALLAALPSKPEGSVADWTTIIGNSRTSCVSGLHGLRAAGLPQSAEGRWKLVEEPAPREPAQPTGAEAGRQSPLVIGRIGQVFGRRSQFLRLNQCHIGDMRERWFALEASAL
jgi:hypothetical protein